MAKSKTTTTTTAKKSTKASETPVAPPAPVEATPAVVAEVATDNTDELVEQTAQFVAKFQTLGQAVASLRSDFRALEKAWSKQLKAAQKQGAKKKRKTGARQPSGFVKPTLISEELASFLGKSKGTEMARTEVTREINKYIRSHDLQDKSNGRKIIPDAALTKLLKLKKGEELTYFNLQRYMSPHFAKAGQPAPSTSA